MCRHCQPLSRRQILAMLAAAPVLTACKAEAKGPEEIRWGREACEICGMIMSDPHFAAEVRGGPDKRLAKFDDIGDAVYWLEAQEWKAAPEVEFWVRDGETGESWHDARQMRYRPGALSPMDYGFLAVQHPASDTVDFAAMRTAVLARGLTWRCLPDGEMGGHKE